MAKDMQNLVLAQLRELRNELQTFRDESTANQHETMQRLTNIERSYAVLQEGMDRVRGDVEQIKRRLRLADIPAPEPGE